MSYVISLCIKNQVEPVKEGIFARDRVTRKGNRVRQPNFIVVNLRCLTSKQKSCHISSRLLTDGYRQAQDLNCR